MIAGATPSHAAAESLCDSSVTNCRTQLLALIDNETVGIDVGFWFMEDSRYATHIINRWNAGVPVRVIADPRANPGHPLNKQMLDSFQSAGIPIMQKSGGGIMHFKMMLFAGQNMVEFGSANFSDNAFVPVSPYTNYVSETIYYCDDPAIVNSFKTKVDNIWTDTTNYKPYANVASRTRTYPTYTISPDMNFPPGQSYTQRLVNLEKAETQQIDVIMFRVTQQAHSDAMIAAKQRGVKVRYLGETNEYRSVDRLWVAWNMDRMWAAGVPMKVRGNQGENHEKLVLMYSKGMSVFGSGNWTSPSDNSQQEHNYFTTKSWIFQWYEDQFNRKWNNSTGNIETTDFVPLPPDTPSYRSPASGATGIATDSQKLVWYGGPWAHYYDIYFGTDPSASTLLAANQPLGPSQTTSQNQSFTLPTLVAGTTYYWRIVSKTAAGLSKAGPIWSFTTTGTTPPPPPPSGTATTVVMWAANVPAANVHGNWTFLTDSSAAGGTALQNPDKGAGKISPALASPANYFEQTFTAEAGTAYHLYVRMRAQNNSMSNDSVSVQFSDSVDSGGLATMRIGSTSASEIVLQGGSSDSGISGWGWADANWSGAAPLVYFAASGTHTVRVQQREDGAIVDQIVLSPDTYLNSPPGPRDNDSTILPSTDTTSGGGGGGGTPGAGTVVMWATNVPSANVHGNWAPAADATAAGGTALLNANQGAAKISPPLASPTSYFEQTFTADAGKAYHLWVRMRAQSNSTANDSVSVQFSDSVDGSGNAIMRIGSATGAEIILQNGSSDPGVSGWGWADANWTGPAVNVYFASSGTHTVRVQQREDGPYVDQIVLSADTYLTTAPGPRDNDSTILPSTDSGSGGTASLGPKTVVVWAANIPAASVTGSWQPLADSTAAGGSALWNPDAGQAKITPALASPSNFFEATFNASAGVAYHLWVRLRAQNDSYSNDSVHVQFSDSVTSAGAATMRIASTSSAEVVLQGGSSGARPHGWGWADNGWGSLGVNIYFAVTGTHTLRVQQREDGAMVDQIVLSGDTFLTSAPGPRLDDRTILPAT